MKNQEIDIVLEEDDYENMPKYELQERAIYGDPKALEVYEKRYKNQT